MALLAVSKTWPADDVRRWPPSVTATSARTGPRSCWQGGELADLPLRWHFIGQLQRNKAAAVARLGAVVHSVDRPPWPACSTGRARRAAGRWTVLVQVDLGWRRRGRRGARGRRPGDVPALADAVAAAPGLRLRGLMAVAPRGEDPAPAFARLAALAARVRADHPGAVELSAGMSGDLEAAVAAGATVVRVGTALFGDRPLASGEDRTTSHTSHTSHSGPGDPTAGGVTTMADQTRR